MTEQTALAVIPETEEQGFSMLENIQTEIDLVRKELEKTKIELEEKKFEYSKLELRKLDPEEQKINDKHVTNINESKTNAEIVQRQRDYDNVMITGKFLNFRAPGQPVKLCYYKHPGDVEKWITFHHGKIYTIKRGFADQISDHYHTPVFVNKDASQMVHSEVVGENSAISVVDTSNKKYGFVPINFNENDLGYDAERKRIG